MSKSKAKKTKKADLSKEIMDQIEKKEVKMKSKLHFVIGSAFLGFGLALAISVSLFCTNLLFFKLKTQNPFIYLPQGRMGLRPFAYLFPWRPLFLSILSIGGGLALLKKYDFSYKKPFRVIVAILVGSIFLSSIFLNLLQANQKARKMKHLKRFYKMKPIPSPYSRLKNF